MYFLNDFYVKNENRCKKILREQKLNCLIVRDNQDGFTSCIIENLLYSYGTFESVENNCYVGHVTQKKFRCVLELLISLNIAHGMFMNNPFKIYRRLTLDVASFVHFLDCIFQFLCTCDPVIKKLQEASELPPFVTPRFPDDGFKSQINPDYVFWFICTISGFHNVLMVSL